MVTQAQKKKKLEKSYLEKKTYLKTKTSIFFFFFEMLAIENILLHGTEVPRFE